MIMICNDDNELSYLSTLCELQLVGNEVETLFAHINRFLSLWEELNGNNENYVRIGNTIFYINCFVVCLIKKEY